MEIHLKICLIFIFSPCHVLVTIRLYALNFPVAKLEAQ